MPSNSDSTHPSPAGLNFADLGVEPQFPSQFQKKANQRPHESAGPPAGEKNPSLALEAMNERVDRRRGKRVSTDEQRVKAKNLAQVRVANVLRHFLINRAVRLEP